MSYRLIDANDLNGKISEEDYKVVLDTPCIYADLPNGLDNEYHEIPKWIPVSERLPEDFGTYLITLKSGDVCLCDFDPDFLGDRVSLSVVATAWMPLKLYKAEK